MSCDFCTNHLQILHLLMVVEAECMLTSIVLNDFSWVAEWIFLPECVAEPSFHQNTRTCRTSPIKMQTDVTLQEKSHSKQETYQTAC